MFFFSDTITWVSARSDEEFLESVFRFPDLLSVFDKTIERLGYDRSKAVQAAMRNFLTDHKIREEGVLEQALSLWSITTKLRV